MGKRHLIDSNVVIDYLDNKLPSKGIEIMNSIIDDAPNISVISKIEILRFNTTDKIYHILKDFIGECV